jgi:lysophospholipase L1-like esterase
VHWDELLDRGDIANRGIGSEITEGYLHRLQNILAVHPAICFIEGGANDIFVHVAITVTIKNLGRLVDTLKQAHIIPVLHLLVPFAAFEPTSNKFNPAIRCLNKRIDQLAKEKGIKCIDLYTPLSQNGT